ncbi:hypothetical protein [Actinomadura monticuli]|uniref:Uncharacterized protein n=1 Tax=Actinomadura monticuli TaxID=3097367 RepID=A0ABV4QP24_9ACTN
MPHPSSAISRLRAPRRRRAPRREAYRFMTRADLNLIVLSSVSADQGPRRRRAWSSAWTLYWRCQWAIASARAEYARRGSRTIRY